MWFSFLAFMITMYVVLDGFDLGVGALHLLLGRTEDDREQATAAIASRIVPSPTMMWYA